MSGRSLLQEDTAVFKPVLCLCSGSGPPLCHWDCLILRIDDAIAGLGGGVDVGVKGGAQPHGEPAFRLG